MHMSLISNIDIGYEYDASSYTLDSMQLAVHVRLNARRDLSPIKRLIEF